MSYQIAPTVLDSICGKAAVDKWLHFLNEAMPKFEIDTRQRVAHFLAQILYESMKFVDIEENLNYIHPQRLLSIFHLYIDERNASKYIKNPKALANHVYANRMGNGDEASGDGWKYRGRGLIQLTGRENYTKLSFDLRRDFVQHPDELLEPEWACQSAAWFWKKNNLNTLADANNIEEITRKINGGTASVIQRTILLEKIMKVLK